MCGIVGVISSLGGQEELDKFLLPAISALSHRGPDDSGFWKDEQCGIGLGHRRLSILDLSQEGHQPMLSASSRYVLSYNGEVYNYRDIRSDLQRKGATFRGDSDTEVMLAAFEEWGIEHSISVFNGMFAFAVWDREQRELTLARDRVGIKPLYYGWLENLFFFTSELNVLRACKHLHPQLNIDQVPAYLRHGYFPAPWSVYRDVYKLLPGCTISWKRDQVFAARADFSPDPHDHARAIRPRIYWSAAEVARRGVATPWNSSVDDAIDHLDGLLKSAVSLRMISDVPLGAFLSGGIDSSTVVAMMQAQGASPVKTFSIGFREQGYDEAPFARAIAKHLGTEHTEVYFEPRDAIALVPKLPEMYDEPFSDSSQLPTFLVSQIARRNVTVALSGDGGDELFYGYDRYPGSRWVWDKISPYPASLRRTISTLAGLFPIDSMRLLYDRAFYRSRYSKNYNNPFIKLQYAISSLQSVTFPDLYGRVMGS